MKNLFNRLMGRSIKDEPKIEAAPAIEQEAQTVPKSAKKRSSKPSEALRASRKANKDLQACIDALEGTVAQMQNEIDRLQAELKRAEAKKNFAESQAEHLERKMRGEAGDTYAALLSESRANDQLGKELAIVRKERDEARAALDAIRLTFPVIDEA